MARLGSARGGKRGRGGNRGNRGKEGGQGLCYGAEIFVCWVLVLFGVD